MLMGTEILDDALDILKALLQGEEVSRNKNTLLYEKFRYSTDVEEMLNHMAHKLELRIYMGNDRLFICPEAGSRLFGWSNEELRDKIPYIITNRELFTGYFIIMTLITMFYKEAYPDTPIAYIKLSDLVEAVSVRFGNLIKTVNPEEISQEKQFDFTEICRVCSACLMREGVSAGKMTR